MKVLIAEDQTPIINALEKIILDVLPDAEVTSSQTTMRAIRLIETNRFDLVISDLDFQEGKRFSVVIAAKKKRIPCIIYSLYYNKSLTEKAKELMVAAYVCKLGKLDHISYAIKNFQSLDRFFCPVTKRKQKNTLSLPFKKVLLRKREEEVLKLIIRGYTQNEAATILNITRGSISSYMRDIIKKNEAPLPQIIRNYLEWNHPE
jgi:DNA-binding NarL/FixJ family response regulator